MSYILSFNPESESWERIQETEISNEADLQELVKKHPETLPVSDLGDNVPPLMVVGRESILPNGAPDLICVDEDGLITIIECKLDRNPEVKRRVIGQILGYGAFLWQCSYDDFEAQIVRRYFDNPKLCHDSSLQGKNLAQAMAEFRQASGTDEGDETAGEWSEDEFQANVERNLQEGRFRLMIVVDKVNDELRRTVEFLNNCTAPHFQVVCAELRYFESGPHRLLVPQLIGVPSVQKSAPAQRGTWDETNYFPTAREQAGEPAATILREVYDFVRQIARIKWGTGTTYGYFIPQVLHGDFYRSLFYARTSGRIYVSFSEMRKGERVTDELLNELRTKLNKLPTIDWDESVLTKTWPSFPVTGALATEEDRELFYETMRWLADELRR